jgi:hypothetical protein
MNSSKLFLHWELLDCCARPNISINTLERLLKAGADLNKSNNKNLTPMHYVTRNLFVGKSSTDKNNKILAMCLDYGGLLNNNCDHALYTPMYFLCKSHSISLSILKLAIDRGGKLSNGPGSPLCRICLNPYLTMDILKYLVEISVDFSPVIKYLIINKVLTIDMLNFILEHGLLTEINTTDHEEFIRGVLLNEKSTEIIHMLYTHNIKLQIVWIVSPSFNSIICKTNTFMLAVSVIVSWLKSHNYTPIRELIRLRGDFYGVIAYLIKTDKGYDPYYPPCNQTISSNYQIALTDDLIQDFAIEFYQSPRFAPWMLHLIPFKFYNKLVVKTTGKKTKPALDGMENEFNIGLDGMENEFNIGLDGK